MFQSYLLVLSTSLPLVVIITHIIYVFLLINIKMVSMCLVSFERLLLGGTFHIYYSKLIYRSKVGTLGVLQKMVASTYFPTMLRINL